MKKTAKVLNDYFNGMKTTASSQILSKISSKLQSMGYKAPFKVAKIEKIAGMTFALPSTSESDQPKSVFDVSWNLKEFIYEKVSGAVEIPFNAIDIDGDTDVGDDTGVINIYLDGEFDRDLVFPLLEEYASRNSSFFKFSEPVVERSNSTGGDVIRFNLIENNTSDLEMAPEMHLSNSNAYSLLAFLQDRGVSGIDLEGYLAEMPIGELKAALNSIEENPLSVNSLEREPVDTGGEGTGEARVVDFGRSAEQVWGYLSELGEMISWVESNDTGDDKIVAY